jgi:hypothetical protein
MLTRRVLYVYNTAIHEDVLRTPDCLHEVPTEHVTSIGDPRDSHGTHTHTFASLRFLDQLSNSGKMARMYRQWRVPTTTVRTVIYAPM